MSATPTSSSARTTTLLLAFGSGSLVAVGLGVYGRLHEAAFFVFDVGGFSSGAAAKAWLATVAFALAIVQLISAMIMYGRIRVTAPPWIGTLHRWSGRVAVLTTVPVAVHCLYALGFEADATRGLVHSVAGCFFYGAFVAKMLVLQRHRAAPGWTLPVFGGAVFTGLTGLWLTAAAWFFGTSGIHL